MEDREIIEMLFARDERAVSAMKQKYGRLLLQIANNILQNQEDARECENDTYFGVWRRIPPEHPQSLSAYLCRIARNTALKRRRDRQAQKRDDRNTVPWEELQECLPSDHLEEVWLAKNMGEKINSWLGTLDRRNRSLFIRRYWFGDSVKDIAAAFGVNSNRISVRLMRLRQSLKEYLQKEGYTL